MKITNFAISVFALAIISLAVSSNLVFAATNSSISIPTPPNVYVNTSVLSLCKGQVNQIPITVTNAGIPFLIDEDTQNLKGPALENVQLSVANSKITYGMGSVYINNISADNSITANVPVFLDANVSPLFSLGFSTLFYYDTFYAVSTTYNLTFTSHDCNVPLSINVTPKTVIQSSTENLSVNLTNTGNFTLRSLLVHFAFPSADLAALSNQTVQISSLAPMSSVKLNETVHVSDNASQFFPLNVTVDYYNGNSLMQAYDGLTLLSSGVITLIPSSLTLSPTTVSPGSIVSISFVLTNVGTESASTVSVSAIAPKGFVPFGSNSVFLGDIAEDGQTPVTLTFTVANRTAAGNYTVPIKINYLNSLRSNLTANITVPVTVTSAAFTENESAASKRFASGGSPFSLLTIVFLISTVVLAYLYIKERKLHRSVK